MGEERIMGSVRQTLWLAAKLLAVVGLVLTTNPESWNHVMLLWGRKQFGTLIPFLAIWAATFGALFIVALHPRLTWRLFWGVLITAGTAAGMGYYWVSHTQLTMLDMLAAWGAAHEAGRATSFYGREIIWTAGLLMASLAIFALPPPDIHARVSMWLRRFSLAPLVPIAMITGVIMIKGGNVYVPLPDQFSTVAMASIVGSKIATQKIPERQEVVWQPQYPGKQGNIVYLVDESIRADYIDLTPGNIYTPNFAALADQVVNFGPASSAGNCSNYSNALLRFGASRMDLIGSVNTNPTLFQYAKRAGMRTVYIDAQAKGLSHGNDLQNFMNLKEQTSIDKFYLLRDMDVAYADDALARIIVDELSKGGPVFIYANKNGSHIPYDDSYPKQAAIFHPTMSESVTDTRSARIASYHNGIAWSVDRFMKNLFAAADFRNTTMIYTSDHGQELDPGHLTHCLAEGAAPQIHLVPLMVHTSDPALRVKFEHGASLLKGKASHFQIAPAIYQLMGYRAADIATKYDESLFDGTSRAPETTSGDIFGLFSSDVHWNPVDLNQNYHEPDAGQPVSIVDKPQTGQQG